MKPSLFLALILAFAGTGFVIGQHHPNLTRKSAANFLCSLDYPGQVCKNFSTNSQAVINGAVEAAKEVAATYPGLRSKHTHGI